MIFFEHRLLLSVKGDVPEHLEPIPLGKARTMREGTDVTVIAIGPLVHRALDAAMQAEDEGISVEVIDRAPCNRSTRMRSWRPSRRRTARSSPTRRSAWGSARGGGRAAAQAFDYLDAPIERVGAKVAPLAFAPVMEQFIIPHAEDVLAAIKRTVGK